MTKWFSIILLSALFGAGLISLRAAEEPSNGPVSRDGSERRREERKPLSLEDRESKMKEPRKTNGGLSRAESEKRREQLKNMTPEERAAKRNEIKGRLEKRIGELRARQTNATITVQEMRELERREQILKRFERDGPALPRIERPKPVFTNSPTEN